MSNEKYYFKPVFEDDPDAAAAAQAEADAAAAAQAEAEAKAQGKSFNQKQVNDLIAIEKGKVQKRYEARIKQLETIRDGANLTGEEIENLNVQIEEMKSEFKTKEQLAAEEASRNKKQYEKELAKAQASSTDWEHRYTDMVIKNAIVEASVINEAFDPDQIVALLRTNTRLAEKLNDEGKKTGDLEPKTKFIGIDEENKEIELDVSPKDVVKRMSQMDKYANLFKRAAVGGLGANNTQRGTGVLGDLKNTNNYMSQRRKGKLDTSKVKGKKDE